MANDDNLRRGSKREVATEAEGHRVFHSLRALTRTDPTPPKLGTPNSWQTLWPVPEKRERQNASASDGKT